MLIKRFFLGLIIFLILTFILSAAGHSGADIEVQLDRVFNDPSFYRAIWGIKIVSLDTGEVIYEKNSHKLFIPASNMKILTAAAALQVYGEDYVFRTPVTTDGKVFGGVLKGDLIVVGRGDPSLGARFTGNNRSNAHSGDPWAVFSGWAENLRKLGIKKIEGDLIGNDQFFEQVNFGDGWSWDDMTYGYSAGFGALQFNETSAYIEIRPGKDLGSLAEARLIPRLESMSVDSALQTVPPECETDVRISRDGRRFLLSGQVASGTGIFYRTVALPNPTTYFLDMLRETLEKEGIRVTGRTVDSDDLEVSTCSGENTLFTHTSPPLKDVLTVLLEISQNQYAESLFRLLDKKEQGKGDEGAAKTMKSLLSSMGVPSDAYEIGDGSGLSRGNLLSPDTIVRVLQYMYRHSNGQQFMEMLPKSGVKGTIKGRMTGTRASEKVFAKTGTLSWVRALSGYLETEKGEILAFSMLVNNYNQPRQSAEYLQDQALEILVGY
ncbi:MAG: D-alanyl-D-alanine carboxypeptidase/D-alanyl-D-alanine-endopeptidase [Acidobacteriota bacterium]